jgi:hypothetical protein
MSVRPFLVSLLVLASTVVPTQAQTYTIKLKVDPDPGRSVVCRESVKGSGVRKFFDPDGKLLNESKPDDTETVFTETTLEKGDPCAVKYKRVFEQASVTKSGEKPKTLSYERRTLLFERTDGKYRVGVVGKPPLDENDRRELIKEANDRAESTGSFHAFTPAAPVKVGESWKLDLKPYVAATMKGALVDLDKSSGEVRLVKVYTKEGTQFGILEVKIRILVTGFNESARFDAPATYEIDRTLDAAIDGTSTAYVSSSTETLKAKGKVVQDKDVRQLFEFDIKGVLRTEQSAEKDDPKGREVPLAEFVSDKPEWKGFTSKEGRFSADFPGTPKETTDKSEKGYVTTHLVGTTDMGSIAYLVAFTDFTGDLAKVDPAIILGKFGGPNDKDAKSRKDITLNGFPGVEVVYQQQQSMIILTHRYYVVKGRLYQVAVAIEKGKGGAAETERFLGSFRLAEKE